MMKSFNYYYNKNLKVFARKLRKNSTKAEIKLWLEVLRAGQMHGYTFFLTTSGSKLYRYFMSKELSLIIEVDGFTHEWEQRWTLDQRRQEILERVGFTVIRFTDEEILNDIRNVEGAIEAWVIGHPPVPLQRVTLDVKFGPLPL